MLASEAAKSAHAQSIGTHCSHEGAALCPCTHLTTQTSSSALSASSASSSASSSSSFFSSAFFASSSSFFLLFSTSLNSFHFFANLSASALSSVRMMLSNMVPPLTCHKSNPRKPKSEYLYKLSSSLYSGLAIFFCSQKPLYAGFEMRLALHSPLYSGLSFIGASHSPSSSSSQSSGFFASGSTMFFFYPIVRLLRFGIIDHGIINPIIGLL